MWRAFKIGTLAVLTGNTIQVGNSYLKQNIDPKVFLQESQEVNSDVENIFNLYRGITSEEFIKERTSENVLFKDPMVDVIGHKELIPTMHALRVLNPQMLGYYVDQNSILIHMKYKFGVEFELYSKLVLEYGKDGKITVIQELWNGVSLYKSVIFRAFSRLNGLIAYGVAKLINN